VVRSSKDEAAIIPFSGSAFLEQGLTRDVFSIYRALERVEVAVPSYTGTGPRIGGIASGPGMIWPREGATAIWDAIVVTSGEILARSQGQRRRAIILLTDGQDTNSQVKRSAAIDRAIESEEVIYALGSGDSKSSGFLQSGSALQVFKPGASTLNTLPATCPAMMLPMAQLRVKALLSLLVASPLIAPGKASQQGPAAQSPSPMVDHTRPHP